MESEADDAFAAAILRDRERVDTTCEARRPSTQPRHVRKRLPAPASDHCICAIERAGDRKRFDLGKTSILFVNTRERNAVEAAYQLYRAQADYAVARGGMLWARGALAKPWAESELIKYGNSMTAAGLNGFKQPGRD